MNIRKLIAGVVCLAAASGFLTGCGSASSTADNEEKVTVWAWDETFNIKAVNEAKKIYENEETEIEVVTMSQDDISSETEHRFSKREYRRIAQYRLD